MLYSVHHKAPSRRELEVRSLCDLCLDSLAAHFELIEDLGPHVSVSYTHLTLPTKA